VLKATALGSGRVRIAAKKNVRNGVYQQTQREKRRSVGAEDVDGLSRGNPQKSANATLVAQFWRCWLTLTAAVVTDSAWAVSRSPIPRGQRNERSILLVRRRGGSPAAIVALGPLGIPCVLYRIDVGLAGLRLLRQ